MTDLSKKPEKLTWQPSWTTGNDLMDQQHQNLIKILNRLVDLNNTSAMLPNGGKDKVSDLFKELNEYTVNHFRDEETLLKKYNYSGLVPHQKLHQNLITQLKNIEDKYNTHGTSILPVLINFLSLWLKEHILGVDKKYGEIVGRRDVP